MKTKLFLACFTGFCLSAALPVWADEEVDATAASAPADQAPAGKLKVETIQVQDRFGTVEEQRVQAMRTELRFLPSSGGEGYHLIDSENAQGTVRNAHRDDSNLMIPSWKLFSW